MPEFPSKQVQRNRIYGLLSLVVILFMPVVVYVWKFGYEISADHSRWAEMGSAMSGIYTPILAILTLMVLIAQVRLQISMNKHTFDQSYVQDVRTDINFYLEQLVSELAKELDDGSTLHDRLIASFAFSTIEELRSDKAIQVAAALNKRNHRLIAVWSAIYGSLAGLKANDYHPYSTHFITTKQKAIALLSYEGCAALDNFMWSATKGALAFSYEFSSSLPCSVQSTGSSGY